MSIYIHIFNRLRISIRTSFLVHGLHTFLAAAWQSECSGGEVRVICVS
jgi:hypothetical protein